MTLDPSKAPEAQDINRYYRDQEHTWQGAIAEWKRADDFYLQTFNVWPRRPEREGRELSQYHPPTATNIVDHAVDALSLFLPRFTRPALGETEQAKEDADRIEKAVSSIVRDAFLQAPFHPGKMLGRHFVMYNYGVGCLMFDPEGFRPRPTKGRGESQEDFEQREAMWESNHIGWNPYRLDAPKPGQVFMEPLEKHPKIAIRKLKLKNWQIAELMLQMDNKRGAETYGFDYRDEDAYESRDLLEYFSASHHAMQLGDENFSGDNLFIERNPWGFQPYIHAWGSGGVIPVDADEFDPKYLARGFIHTVMDTLVNEAQRKTAQHEVLIRAAYAKRGFMGDPAEAREQLEGDILTGDKDEWWVENLPTLPNQIFEYGKEQSQDIQQGSFNLQVAGFRQTGVDTATQQIILSEASSRKFTTIITQMNYIYSLIGSNILRLSEVVKDIYGLNKIVIGTDEIRASDVRGNYRIFASFENIDPVVHNAEKSAALAELQAGLSSRQDYWRVARVEDATGRELRILEDQVKMLPEVKLEMLKLVAERMGLSKIADKLDQQGGLEAALMQMMTGAEQPGAPPGDAAPPGTPAPPLPEQNTGAGLVGPTGRPLARSPYGSP